MDTAGGAVLVCWCTAGGPVILTADCWLVSIETILIETLHSNGEIWGAVISCILCCEVGGGRRQLCENVVIILVQPPRAAQPPPPHNYCLFSLRSSGETCQDDSHHHHQPATFITERCSCIPKSGEPTK